MGESGPEQRQPRLVKKQTIKQFVWALGKRDWGGERVERERESSEHVSTSQPSDLYEFICTVVLALSRVLGVCPGYWMNAPSWPLGARGKRLN